MKKMKRKIVLIAGLVLLAVALVAMPASAGYNQGGNTGGCHGAHACSQDCAEYSYVNGQCTGNSCHIAENYCLRNSGEYCLNNGTCLLNGTGNCYGNGNSGNCPCI
ncbi:hypothetical protein [Methanolacinia paynteri]|uniref:hypothetical protein n=1 Tax=Methanolacinia paynteri TaxID=230356 RepID=UPI00064F6209|nr:hypothetical protein [Methanolacinia paynteri]